MNKFNTTKQLNLIIIMDALKTVVNYHSNQFDRVLVASYRVVNTPNSGFPLFPSLLRETPKIAENAISPIIFIPLSFLISIFHSLTGIAAENNSNYFIHLKFHRIDTN